MKTTEFFVAVSLFSCSLAELASATNATEDNLISYLMAGYNMHARPSMEVVNVTLSFNLESINKLEEREQLLNVAGFVNAYWEDLRLSWKPEEWGGLKSISLPADMVWKPDFALINSAGDIYNKAFYSSYYLLQVESDGSVSWFPHGEMSVRCSLDLTYYPFDSQRCHFRFENWVYQTDLCKIQPLSNEISLDDFTGSGEWNITETSAVGIDMSYSDNTTYSDIFFYITLQRKTSFYLLHSVFPCAVMSALVCLVFVLPAESEEKVALNITLMLSFVVLLVDVSNDMPRTSDYTPLLSRYITFVTTISALSLLCTIYVIRLSHHGTKEIPGWIERVLIQKIGVWLLIVPRKRKDEESVSHASSRATVKVYPANEPELPVQVRIESLPKNVLVHASEKLLNEILTTLKEMHMEHGKSRDAEHRRQMWMLVGMVVDRIFFCLFVLATLSASIVIMALLPQSSSPPPVEH